MNVELTIEEYNLIIKALSEFDSVVWRRVMNEGDDTTKRELLRRISNLYDKLIPIGFDYHHIKREVSS